LTRKAYDKIRDKIPFIEDDTVMYPYIHTCSSLVSSDTFDEFFTGDEEA